MKCNPFLYLYRYTFMEIAVKQVTDNSMLHFKELKIIPFSRAEQSNNEENQDTKRRITFMKNIIKKSFQ